jgi:hypothetical protein
VGFLVALHLQVEQGQVAGLLEVLHQLLVMAVGQRVALQEAEQHQLLAMVVVQVAQPVEQLAAQH